MLVSTIKEHDEEVTYPCLRRLKTNVKNDNMVVLFTKYRTGTVVYEKVGENTTGMWGIGCYATDWDMSQFEAFNGSVTIKFDINEE